MLNSWKRHLLSKLSVKQTDEKSKGRASSEDVKALKRLRDARRGNGEDLLSNVVEEATLHKAQLIDAQKAAQELIKLLGNQQQPPRAGTLRQLWDLSRWLQQPERAQADVAQQLAWQLCLHRLQLQHHAAGQAIQLRHGRAVWLLQGKVVANNGTNTAKTYSSSCCLLSLAANQQQGQQHQKQQEEQQQQQQQEEVLVAATEAVTAELDLLHLQAALQQCRRCAPQLLAAKHTLALPRAQRCARDLQAAAVQLSVLELLSSRPPSLQQAILKELQYLACPAGCVVFSEGERVDLLLILLSGRVALCHGPPQAHASAAAVEAAAVAELHAGDALGRVTDKRRAFTAVCLCDCELVVLPKVSYQRLVQQEQGEQQQQVERFLSGLPFLKDRPAWITHRAASFCSALSAEAGTVIVQPLLQSAPAAGHQHHHHHQHHHQHHSSGHGEGWDTEAAAAATAATCLFFITEGECVVSQAAAAHAFEHRPVLHIPAAAAEPKATAAAIKAAVQAQAGRSSGSSMSKLHTGAGSRGAAGAPTGLHATSLQGEGMSPPGGGSSSSSSSAAKAGSRAADRSSFEGRRSCSGSSSGGEDDGNDASGGEQVKAAGSGGAGGASLAKHLQDCTAGAAAEPGARRRARKRAPWCSSTAASIRSRSPSLTRGAAPAAAPDEPSTSSSAAPAAAAPAARGASPGSSRAIRSGRSSLELARLCPGDLVNAELLLGMQPQLCVLAGSSNVRLLLLHQQDLQPAFGEEVLQELRAAAQRQLRWLQQRQQQSEAARQAAAAQHHRALAGAARAAVQAAGSGAGARLPDFDGGCLRDDGWAAELPLGEPHKGRLRSAVPAAAELAHAGGHLARTSRERKLQLQHRQLLAEQARRSCSAIEAAACGVVEGPQQAPPAAAAAAAAASTAGGEGAAGAAAEGASPVAAASCSPPPAGRGRRGSVLLAAAALNRSSVTSPVLLDAASDTGLQPGCWPTAPAGAEPCAPASSPGSPAPMGVSFWLQQGQQGSSSCSLAASSASGTASCSSRPSLTVLRPSRTTVDAVPSTKPAEEAPLQADAQASLVASSSSSAAAAAATAATAAAAAVRPALVRPISAVTPAQVAAAAATGRASVLHLPSDDDDDDNSGDDDGSDEAAADAEVAAIMAGRGSGGVLGPTGAAPFGSTAAQHAAWLPHRAATCPVDARVPAFAPSRASMVAAGRSSAEALAPVRAASSATVWQRAAAGGSAAAGVGAGSGSGSGRSSVVQLPRLDGGGDASSGGAVAPLTRAARRSMVISACDAPEVARYTSARDTALVSCCASPEGGLLLDQAPQAPGRASVALLPAAAAGARSSEAAAGSSLRSSLPAIPGLPAAAAAAAGRASVTGSASKAGPGSTLFTFSAQQAQQAAKPPPKAERVRPYVSWVRPRAVDDPAAASGMPCMHAVVFLANRSGVVRGASPHPPPQQQRPRQHKKAPAPAAAGAPEAACAAGVQEVNGKLMIGPALPLDVDACAPPLAGPRLSCPTGQDINYILGKWRQRAEQQALQGGSAAELGAGQGLKQGPPPGAGGRRSLEMYGATSTMICK